MIACAPMRPKRRKFHTPNAKDALLDRWRHEGSIKVIGILTMAGGALSGKAIANFLGISPRGLHPFLKALLTQRIIEPDIRSEEGELGEKWYVLNRAALPEPGQHRLMPYKIMAPLA